MDLAKLVLETASQIHGVHDQGGEMSKHTPGPALEVATSGNCWRSKIADKDGARVGYAYGPTQEEAEGRAAQYAAAPDLLKALMLIRGLGNSTPEYGGDSPDVAAYDAVVMEMYEIAVNAIDKAEGEK